jgi:peptidoglycan/LPS O-acetylase OafA/YrhL
MKSLINTQRTSSSAYTDTKPHYDLLDGLRGVAALLVLWYHVFEGYQFAGNKPIVENINHGYLAVDFFFILSGFVISYAYDDRIRRTMNMKDFFKRRLIRLHPMVVMGALIGTATFFMQGAVRWDGSHVATSAVMIALLCALFFIPATPGSVYEVRGNGEMFPLNGPAWSLFFEYIGNILYALVICRLSTKALKVVVIGLGLLLGAFALTDYSGYGCLGVGWTLDGVSFVGGALRMLFPFTLGMWVHRSFRPLPVRGAFWICSVTLLLLFLVPFIPGLKPICYNGLFEMFCIALVFPFLVRLGASGNTTDRLSSTVCKFLGDISFPVYIIHYPLYYLFYAWLIRNQRYTFGETWLVAIGLIIMNVALAYLCLKCYDEPVRRALTKHLMKRRLPHS